MLHIKSNAHTRALSLFIGLSLPRSLARTRTHAHSLSLALSRLRLRMRSLSLTHTPSLSSFLPPPSLPPSFAHSLASHSPIQTLTHTPSHINMDFRQTHFMTQ